MPATGSGNPRSYTECMRSTAKINIADKITEMRTDRIMIQPRAASTAARDRIYGNANTMTRGPSVSAGSSGVARRVDDPTRDCPVGAAMYCLPSTAKLTG